MATTINLGDSTGGQQGPYPLAIFFAIATFSIIVLLIPPFVSHFKNRNIGATVLVLSAIVGDLISFLNAIIWSNDDIDNWWTGAVFCDIEIKIIVVQQVMFCACIAMILRGLAQVMDTNSSNWNASAAKKRRNVIIDLVCCVGLPMLQTIAQWITQPFRYYILGIAGCVPPTDGSWLYVLLTMMPSVGWACVDVYYSILLIVRLYRYRRAFNQIMSANNTTKSRFLRLYLLSTLCVIGLIPAQAYVLYAAVSPGILHFSWNETHHPTEYSWNSIIMVPSKGQTFYDRWIWLAGSFMIFVFFGFGADAVKTYKEVLLGVGMGRIVPSLKPGYTSSSGRRDTIGTFGSVSSRAKSYFSKRKDSGSMTSSATDSMRSPTLISTRRSTFRDMNEKRTNTGNKFIPTFLANFFDKTTTRKASNSNDPFVMATYNRQGMVQSNISTEPRSPSSIEHSKSFSGDVMVRKEVRQGSETVIPVLGKETYEGV